MNLRCDRSLKKNEKFKHYEIENNPQGSFQLEYCKHIHLVYINFLPRLKEKGNLLLLQFKKKTALIEKVELLKFILGVRNEEF